MMRMYLKLGIDRRKSLILVYPTLHYQNGRLLIKDNGENQVKKPYAAEECAGGIHGKNRWKRNGRKKLSY
ncbi:hypothetical protein [uncultured Ilyobacter sp.]|uniref:hypothetical protein n=1 Tax=uncultured Ilyobacter sp. TaxID=544433 RepID=UPI0029C7A52E|nr:hypothetical protein [uncultured Ilyobacter sp.]